MYVKIAENKCQQQVNPKRKFSNVGIVEHHPDDVSVDDHTVHIRGIMSGIPDV